MEWIDGTLFVVHAPFLPAFHFSQIALSVLHAPSQGSIGQHLSALVAFTLIFAGIAWLRTRSNEERIRRFVDLACRLRDAV